MTATSENDVVQLLLSQHDEIRKLFTAVEEAVGDSRKQTFDMLRALLAVHETAEEEIVHPYARGLMNKTSPTVDRLLDEENEAKRILARLDDMDTGSREFLPLLRELQKAVEAHAEHEEKEEFPELRRRAKPEELRGMATLVKAAEAVAPTRPHPGTESAKKNLLLGPFASIADRARDAIRAARR